MSHSREVSPSGLGKGMMGWLSAHGACSRSLPGRSYIQHGRYGVLRCDPREGRCVTQWKRTWKYGVSTEFASSDGADCIIWGVSHPVRRVCNIHPCLVPTYFMQLGWSLACCGLFWPKKKVNEAYWCQSSFLGAGTVGRASGRIPDGQG